MKGFVMGLFVLSPRVLFQRQFLILEQDDPRMLGEIQTKEKGPTVCLRVPFLEECRFKSLL